MTETQSRKIGSQAVRAGFNLVARQILVQGLNLGGGIILARILLPGDFGIFAILNFFIAFSASLSELGLGYRLIRQAEEPTHEDYQAVFTFQAACSLSVVAVLLIASGAMAERFQMGDGGRLMIMAVSANILLAAFQSMAVVSLERRLEFGKLAKLEVFQTLVYHAVTLSLAYSGYGPWSFIWAAAARSVIGASVLRVMAPWPLAIRWDWPRIRAHAKPGMLFQASTFANIARDSIVPTLIGALSGPVAVGYVTWALMLSLYTNILLNVLNRVYLPVFSRLQHLPEALGEALSRAVAWTNRVSAPITVFFLVYDREIVTLVFTEKWLPALPLVRLFLIANVFVATSTPCYGMLNALGQVRRTLGYSLAWSALTWAIGAPLIHRLGFVGFGWAVLIVNFSNLYLFRDCIKRVPVRLAVAAIPPWIWASACGAAVFWIKHRFPVSGLPMLAVQGSIGAVLYLAALWAFHGKGIIRDWRLFSNPAS